MIKVQNDVWERLALEDRPVIIYGTGNGADKIIDELNKRSIKLRGVMASDDFVRGQSFRGFTVKRLSELERDFADPVIIIGFGSQRPEVIENILSLAKRYTVLCADVPVYGNDIFDRAYFAAHEHEIREACDLLADEQSKRVFRSVIEFRLTGGLDRLTSCFTPKEEAFENILRLGTDESYLDLGAYRGDTIESFLMHTGGNYRHITALEPDRKTYLKLRQYAGGFPDVQLFNMGIWDSDTDLSFESSLGRGSSIADTGKQALSVTCIDTLYRKRPVTFIKADVEGAEERAINGGRLVLQRDRPKLDIALYHRTRDIFALPLLIHSIVPEYKIFMRQHPHIPAWDLDLYALGAASCRSRVRGKAFS